MLYYDDLEEIIFTKHELLSDEPDNLTIISGYLGPGPINHLKDLDFNVNIIGGMYNNGISPKLWNSLKKSMEKNKKLTIEFSTMEIHSKIYVWKLNGKILSGLIGSANFSSPGLRSEYRETLADMTRDSFKYFEKYLKIVRENSIREPIINKSLYEDISFDNKEKKDVERLYTCDIPLYSETKSKGKYMPEKSGLNWGFSLGHVAEGDAYIRIPKQILKQNSKLIKPYDPKYENKLKSNKKRNSNPIELIWDDGYVMEASLEGIQSFEGKDYPKQLTSYSYKRPLLNNKRISVKSILGRYLRKRLNVPINKKITLNDLERYGRTTITLSYVEDGIYYADFSV